MHLSVDTAAMQPHLHQTVDVTPQAPAVPSFAQVRKLTNIAHNLIFPKGCVTWTLHYGMLAVWVIKHIENNHKFRQIFYSQISFLHLHNE